MIIWLSKSHLPEHNLESFGGSETRWIVVWFVYQRQISVKHLFAIGCSERKQNHPTCSGSQQENKEWRRLESRLHISTEQQSLFTTTDMFSRFVRHTASLISLSRGSRQVCHCRSSHSLLIICTNSKSSSFQYIYYFMFPNFGGSSSRLWSRPSVPSPAFLIELSLHLHVCFQSPQCCKRKLVAMLMSLFDARRASSASILEKPISTSRATCWGWWSQVRRLNNFPQGINEASTVVSLLLY